MPDLTTKPLIQNGRIVLDPAPYGDVVHQQAAFHHHLFQVAVAERVAQIPPNAQDDDHVLEVSPSEQRRAVLAHASPYQICLRVFCNRSFPAASSVIAETWGAEEVVSELIRVAAYRMPGGLALSAART